MRYYIKERYSEPVKFYNKIDTNVMLVKLIPGMSADIFDYVAEHAHAVIIESFGVGGLPNYETGGYYPVVEHWISQGKIVIMTTQVTNEGSNMSVYEVGRSIKNDFGLLESYDMTLEATVTKTMWALAVAENEAEFRELFYQTINHDMLFQNLEYTDRIE